MIISIASGKGGTGKTTVATNLALSLGADVQLLDCDVEEPNAHLFIQPVIEDVKTITTPVPEVDMDKCTLCGSCDACFSQVYEVDKGNGRVNMRDEYCVSCGMCVGVCPAKAITLVDRKTKKEVIWAGEGLAKPYVDLLKAKNLL